MSHPDSNESQEKIVNTIQKTANTGEKGDGVVFTYSLDKLVKIKDGKTGADAI